jgi:uncharacterized protein (DUF58 family)
VNKSQKYFDPKTLARIRPLGLRARTLVEGLVSGLHRSPLRGHSIEFAQHREYVPGDDLRQVDWKIYARSDKYYLKQYEDETSLTCQLLVDHSQSMQYGSHKKEALSKLQYAQLIAFSLAYLVIQQQDYAGLITFSEQIDEWLPPSSSPSQFEDMVRVMERAEHFKKTDLSHVMEQVTTRLGRRSLLVLISDMFDDPERILRSLKILRYAGHDGLLIHVLDRDEVDFPFDGMSRFEGLESTAPVITDPLMIRTAYCAAMANFCQKLEIGCRQMNIDYFRVLTDESLAVSLPHILASRSVRGF